MTQAEEAVTWTQTYDCTLQFYSKLMVNALPLTKLPGPNLDYRNLCSRRLVVFQILWQAHFAHKFLQCSICTVSSAVGVSWDTTNYCIQPTNVLKQVLKIPTLFQHHTHSQ